MTSGNIKFELVSAGSQLQDALEQGLRKCSESNFLLIHLDDCTYSASLVSSGGNQQILTCIVLDRACGTGRLDAHIVGLSFALAAPHFLFFQAMISSVCVIFTVLVPVGVRVAVVYHHNYFCMFTACVQQQQIRFSPAFFLQRRWKEAMLESSP